MSIQLLRAEIKGFDIPYNGPYCESNAIGHSDLRKIASCPSRWFKAPKHDDPTDSMLWGSLVDALLFGIGFDRFEVRPETYSRFNEKTREIDVKPWIATAAECKAWLADHEGKEIISKQFKQDAIVAVNLIRADHRCFELLKGARFQCWLEGVYLDTDTGLEITVRGLVDIVPDRFGEYGCYLADLKTTADASMGKWKRTLEDRWYHVQAAIYLDMWNKATGENRTEFAHIVQENEYPYEIAHRSVSDEWLRQGRACYKAALQTYARCKASGVWEGLDASSEGWEATPFDAYVQLRSGIQNEDSPMPNW
jgi:hypothetical protein